jgi:ANTAR domain
MIDFRLRPNSAPVVTRKRFSLRAGREYRRPGKVFVSPIMATGPPSGCASMRWGDPVEKAIVSADRRMRLWVLVVEQARGGPVTVEHVCAVLVDVAGVDSVGVAVMLAASIRETLYASDRQALELEELTLTIGEGPGIDAQSGHPDLVADLDATESLVRWPLFAPAAIRAGVRAIFALPLAVGGVRVGVMALYRAHPGDLGSEQLADALALADTVCGMLLDAAHSESPPDARGPERAGLHYPEVHQATGMITVQLGVTATVALVRLRAYAYAHDRRLREVARDVVDRRLRFDDVDVGGG